MARKQRHGVYLAPETVRRIERLDEDLTVSGFARTAVREKLEREINE